MTPIDKKHRFYSKNSLEAAGSSGMVHILWTLHANSGDRRANNTLNTGKGTRDEQYGPSTAREEGSGSRIKFPEATNLFAEVKSKRKEVR